MLWIDIICPYKHLKCCTNIYYDEHHTHHCNFGRRSRACAYSPDLRRARKGSGLRVPSQWKQIVSKHDGLRRGSERLDKARRSRVTGAYLYQSRKGCRCDQCFFYLFSNANIDWRMNIMVTPIACIARGFSLWRFFAVCLDCTPPLIFACFSGRFGFARFLFL